jgi:hypothetical protein
MCDRLYYYYYANIFSLWNILPSYLLCYSCYIKDKFLFQYFHQLYKKISAAEDIRRPEVACSAERGYAALPTKDPGQRVGEDLLQPAPASNPLHCPLRLAHLPLQPLQVRLHPLYERLQPGDLLKAGSQAFVLGHNGWEALLANKRMTNIKENKDNKASGLQHSNSFCTDMRRKEASVQL